MRLRLPGHNPGTAPGAAPDSGLSSDDFERLYREQWPAVVDYLRFRVGPDDAGDLAADVFARGWAARDQFDPARGTPVEWVWGIARNAAKDWLRRQRGPAETLSETLPASLDVAGEGARRELMAVVARAVRRLDPLDQDIVALRFGGGMSNRATGHMVGLSETAAAQRLHRAVLRLRKDLRWEDAE